MLLVLSGMDLALPISLLEFTQGKYVVGVIINVFGCDFKTSVVYDS